MQSRGWKGHQRRKEKTRFRQINPASGPHTGSTTSLLQRIEIILRKTFQWGREKGVGGLRRAWGKNNSSKLFKFNENHELLFLKGI